MVTNSAVKKKVVVDWQNAFPQLSIYSQDKLYKVVGPVIIGLELIKLPRTAEYRPHFVMYSLFGNKVGKDIKACLSGPIMLREYSDKKGFQFNIPYENHSNLFNDVLESVRKQTPLSFDGDIPLKKLISVIDEYSKTPPLSAAPNSYLQAALQETKLQIALYISVAEAQSIFEEISKRNWDVNNFTRLGINANKWLQSLQEKISRREEALKLIESNKLDKKISQLKKSELLP